jgi:hypothetical protein
MTRRRLPAVALAEAGLRLTELRLASHSQSAQGPTSSGPWRAGRSTSTHIKHRRAQRSWRLPCPTLWRFFNQFVRTGFAQGGNAQDAHLVRDRWKAFTASQTASGDGGITQARLQVFLISMAEFATDTLESRGRASDSLAALGKIIR